MIGRLLTKRVCSGVSLPTPPPLPAVSSTARRSAEDLPPAETDTPMKQQYKDKDKAEDEKSRRLGKKVTERLRVCSGESPPASVPQPDGQPSARHTTKQQWQTRTRRKR